MLLDNYLKPTHATYPGKGIVDSLVVIRYHSYGGGGGDPMYNVIGSSVGCDQDFAAVRLFSDSGCNKWYPDSNGTPAFWVDGEVPYNPALISKPVHDMVTQTQAETTPVKISLEGSTFNDLTVNVKVTITSETDLSAEPLYLFVAATIDSVEYNGRNGETHHEQVFLGFIGDTNLDPTDVDKNVAQGKAITLKKDEAIEWTDTWTMWSDYPNPAHGRNQGNPSDWNTTVWDKKNMNLVAFVQNKTTKEVMQVEMISRRTMPTSQPPVVTAISDITIDEDSTSNVVVIATDADGDLLTYSATADTSAIEFEVTSNNVLVKPLKDWNGSSEVIIAVTDGMASVNTSFTLTVSPVNDIALVSNVSIDEDKNTNVTLNSTLSGTTTFTAVSDKNTVTTSISSSVLTLVPNANWNGVANITAYASNSTAKDSTTFTLTVNAIPDLPGEFTWTNSTSENDSITITSSNMSFEWSISWDKSIDPDGEDVTYKIFNTNPPFNMVPVDLFELSFTQTTIDFPYETFILRWPSTLQMVNRLTYKYNVYAYSGNDSTEITGTRVLVVKRVGDLNTESIEPPNSFVLHPNYPNPFNPQTQIRFEMPYAGKIDLSIYNLLGVKVKTLYSGQKPSGVFTFKWDGKNDNNQLVSGGVYIYKLQSEKGMQMRKMILLK